jgi:inorganic pyrophosphatase
MLEGSFLKKKYHPNFPLQTYVLIEIPRGSNLKYEFDEDLKCYKLDRKLEGGFSFPFNYGYIPNTMGEDGDPLDVVVYLEEPISPFIALECTVLGVLDMNDGGKKDYKFICAPTFSAVDSLSSLPDVFLPSCEFFFKNYKKFFKGDVDVLGVYDQNFALDLLNLSKN